MIHFLTGILTILLILSWNIQANTDETEYQPVLDQIKLCVSCHGDNGATLQPTFPILSGQHFYYLYVQLKDFKSGLRKNNVMGPIASQLEKSQMKLLAKYFSEQDWPNLGYRANPARKNIWRFEARQQQELDNVCNVIWVATKAIVVFHVLQGNIPNTC